MTKLIDFNFFIQVNNIFTACSFYHLCSVGGANTIVLAERKLLEPDPDNTGVGSSNSHFWHLLSHIRL